ncbi:MAG: hypothetical protein A2600_13030 [Candidatus Lambdaproteobacteria bacterium RIFOXYD1_FULL_56_27]|uniref:Uncharacterized protein n=1 Tax=Candidatus Lambdaproteobacteria bacterium RIFOXYD2_FULL_56_26 TaxID=1817773 RepID=A0A1F6GLA0_9PROT|nr:MAG: hypothetical protein A2557_13205 [Candidatus Lambdaproteobacteria bacterium RIFOXYD2_FULL_56_26]OGH03600.1 MAG: hypothetical protein A2426_06390 [Candidatus Lambdaproteobacteria bacterium RIFOXYC1_FULL_56_13]OGH08944.1 MAG: hypothetical protein A2600_13030 [Candidatus Lambdaproteobacteria bacterium RIFOXYD1_FULL_56_27]
MAPLAKSGFLGPDVNLAIAALIGFGFGFFLERAGFGSAKKLTAQWFGTDWSVFRVMFTGIVVAMIGILALDSLGILPFDSLYLNDTFLLPQTIGGLMMGGGFVIGGYCPGTAFVGLASGKWDALLYILGLCLGVVVAGELWDLIEPIMSIGSMGRVTLFEFFGVSSWLIGAVVIVIAVAGTRFANWFEQRSRGKNV